VHLNFGESLIEATATHLSEGGMVVQTPVPLELHRTGTLRFKLPDLPSPLEAQGEMAWAGDGQHAGIRFVHMPMASRHLLKRWLAERASREIEAKPSGNTVGGGPRGLAPVAISAVALSAAS
jgi:hypothetical protein